MRSWTVGLLFGAVLLAMAASWCRAGVPCQGTSQIWAETDTQLLTNNGVPIAIVPFATPFNVEVDLKADLGFYVQDTWTVDRTSLNLGLRFDYVRQDVPAQDTSVYVDTPPGSNPPGTWAPTRTFDAIPKAANWTDLSPRIGVAHDLFGDGRTALKASVSRYLRVDTIAMGASVNPVNAFAFASLCFVSSSSVISFGKGGRE